MLSYGIYLLYHVSFASSWKPLFHPMLRTFLYLCCKCIYLWDNLDHLHCPSFLLCNKHLSNGHPPSRINLTNDTGQSLVMGGHGSTGSGGVDRQDDEEVKERSKKQTRDGLYKSIVT